MKYKLIALFLMAATINSCGAGSSQNAKAQSADETKVLIKTTAGDITIKLYNETPKHRDNFIKLVEDHFYDGILFHRVIRDFMVQAGDPNSKNAAKGDTLGSGGPGYSIPAEFVYPKYFHKRGALAAARTGDQVNPERRSSGSQFYIVTGKIYGSDELKSMAQRMAEVQKQEIFRRLVMENRTKIEEMQKAQDNDGLNALQNDLIQQTEAEAAKNPFKLTDEQLDAYTSIGGTPHLDGQYTVFGEVIEGMDVVDKIQNVTTGRMDRPTVDVKIVKARILK